MTYFNCHTHTFNMQYVPDEFLSLQTSPYLARLLHQALNTKFISAVTLAILKPVTGKKTIAFLKIGLQKTQDMVFAHLCSQYPTEDDVKYVVLPLDFTHMGAGNLSIPYKQQLDDLFDLKLKYPNKCFPFVAIDPRSGSAVDNKNFVEEYINKGFAGIKLYPALGFFAFDYRMEEVFRYAEQNCIPVITHCSSGGVNYAQKTAPESLTNPVPFYRIAGKNYVFPQNNRKMADYCDQFNDPSNFMEALYRFPELKICFAHFGLNAKQQFAASGLGWFNTIVEMLHQYKNFPNIYADISYSVAYPHFCRWFKQQYGGWPPQVQDRILFGTDFFMTVQEEHGDDKAILEVAKSELGNDLFQKLAYANVMRYLTRDCFKSR